MKTSVKQDLSEVLPGLKGWVKMLAVIVDEVHPGGQELKREEWRRTETPFITITDLDDPRVSEVIPYTEEGAIIKEPKLDDDGNLIEAGIVEELTIIPMLTRFQIMINSWDTDLAQKAAINFEALVESEESMDKINQCGFALLDLQGPFNRDRKNQDQWERRREINIRITYNKITVREVPFYPPLKDIFIHSFLNL